VADDIDGVRAAVAGLPDEELLKIADVDCGRHPTPTLRCAREELVRRGRLEPGSWPEPIKVEVRTTPSPWFEWIPRISSEATALRAAKHGAIAAWVVAGAKALIVVFASTTEAFAKVGVSTFGLIDAAIYLGVGIAIWRGSFAFAIIGALLFALDRASTWATTGHFPLFTALLIFFMNGVRGAHALRTWRGTHKPPGTSASSTSS
jgi:hypothetical protein